VGLIPEALPDLEDVPLQAQWMAVAADRHLAVGLPRTVGGDYVGEHWLASFAALALGDVP
jgi:hypothetical protein